MSKSPSLSFLKKKTETASSQAGSEPVETTYADPITTVSPRSSSGKEIPSWQVGKRAVTVWVDEEQYRRVNALHYEVRKPVRELFQEALDLMLLAYDQEPKFKAEAMKLVTLLRPDKD